MDCESCTATARLDSSRRGAHPGPSLLLRTCQLLFPCALRFVLAPLLAKMGSGRGVIVRSSTCGVCRGTHTVAGPPRLPGHASEVQESRKQCERGSRCSPCGSESSWARSARRNHVRQGRREGRGRDGPESARKSEGPCLNVRSHCAARLHLRRLDHVRPPPPRCTARRDAASLTQRAI